MSNLSILSTFHCIRAANENFKFGHSNGVSIGHGNTVAVLPSLQRKF